VLDADGDPAWRCLEVPSHLDALQSARALALLSAYHDWGGIDVVWIERPMGKHIRSIADLSRTLGVILSGIPPSIPVSEITPGEWKKTIGLRGHATKQDVGRWARDHARAGFAGNLADGDLDEHEADAFAIATACRIASERAVQLIGSPL